MVNPDLLNFLVVDNCSIKGDAFALLIKGLNQLNKVGTLHIKRMDISSEAAIAVSDLVRRATNKRCVDDFRIERCAVSSDDLQ